MMLHEAVMLEIYRQALTARELAGSPTRCLSRDSRDSRDGGARSPSDESVYSGRGIGMTSPMGMALPATLPPAAAAALLPPQSAAMAAYLGVAAAAAQQNRLFLNSAAASLSNLGVDNPAALLAPGLGPILDFSGKRSTSSSTGSNKSRDHNEKSDEEGGGPEDEEMDEENEDEDEEMEDMEDGRGGDNEDGVVNLSNKSSGSRKRSLLMRHRQPGRSATSGSNNGSNNNSPLDLTTSRKRSAIDNLALLTAAGGNQNSPLHHLAASAAAAVALSAQHSPQSPGGGSGLPRKLSRLMPDYKQWPYGAAANAAFFANSLASPKGAEGNAAGPWNGSSSGSKMKMGSTSDATKALEKMSELSRLGGGGGGSSDRNSVSPTTGGFGSKNSPMMPHNQPASGRHSAWQSHWLNKGADSAKDVLKCVWCKQSFTSLAALTTHMKETKHCGVNMPPNAQNPSQNNHHHGQQQQQQQRDRDHHHHHQGRESGGRGGAGDRDGGNKSDLNLLIKETMPLPRKLVRGQDVWLGKGAEQTRQILKCMWCGQSFRSLAEMTSHMQQTQHYTNIISQEQIISWKSDDGKNGPAGGASGGGAAAGGAGNTPASTGGSSSDRSGVSSGPPSGPHHSNAQAAAQANSTVSAVLTCKVCDQAFSSLKDLSNHMVKNSHYKEHIMRSITESGSRRRQTREKRKKSLPVRKLLELERAQHDYKNGSEMPSAAAVMSKTMREAASGRITCEKCGDKIDTALFVEHIRQCVGGVPMPPSIKSSSGGALSPMGSSRDGRKSSSTINDEMLSPGSRLISPQQGGSPKDGEGSGEKNNSSPSVLNALEQLIEKSFDTRSRHSGGPAGGQSNAGGGSSGSQSSQPSTPLGASILKRLGIDESVDYTKPLIDPQTMNLLRSYQAQQHHQQMFAAAAKGRERSGSESSSFSDRTNSRMDSVTPDRKYESMSVHSRNSPDRKRDSSEDKEDSLPLHRIKREMIEERAQERKQDSEETPVKVKTEAMEEEGEPKETASKRGSMSSPACSPRRTPVGTPMASPAASDRSITPRSVASNDGGNASKGKSHMTASSSSLGALSSMFDNLTGNSASGGGHEGGESSGKKKGPSHNPLAALQKLCDKTENTPARSNSNSNPLAAMANTAASALGGSGGGGGGANNGNSVTGSGLLAFSWACNDAVMTADSIIKCAFCDTPFISKGAYRHHLSKMHFIKDDGLPDVAAMKSSQRSTPNTPAIAKSPTPPALSPKSSAANGMSALPLTTSNNSNRSPTPTSTSTTPTPGNVPAFEESPHSKFLKYTELAKQLSSKYV